ncbi:hypothetical protein CUU80_02315 [Bifidobacterium scaligerum]|uniref:Uncharacterized protein n=2 Tax=Bifidobacterium scaligerum TaxID=2052656 RepID=A0A2M9HT64_9BIFI|nr:hypothetical protein CUU80_02315 [Bifidobacterium scaligerum]
MSEPFWKGKTCEELEGLRVRVFFGSGAVAEGMLNAQMLIVFTRGLTVTVFHYDGEHRILRPCVHVESVELLDAPDYERIEDFDDVSAGDIAVFANGNRHQVTDVDHEDGIIRIRAIEAPGASVWADDRMFDYALRRKPRLPDKPGPWMDKDGDLWFFAEVGRMNPLFLQGTRVSHQDKWVPQASQIHVYSDKTADQLQSPEPYAPFRPYKPGVES